MSQETIEQTFNISAPARLKLSNVRGSVDIRTGEDGVISVTAVKQTHTGDVERTKIELSQDSDGTVTVATRFPDGTWNWLFGSHPCCVDYIVKAPRLCSLKVNGVSNTVVAEGFEGDFDFNSVSGEVTLRDLTGLVKFKTVSGDVSGERLSGPLHLNTVSGDVSLSESALPSLEATTVSGDVNLKTTLAEGPYRFNSVSGDVRLTVPPDTHCTTELHSVSGDFSTAFPVTGYSRHHGSHIADVQSGGVKVYVSSVSGDLLLDSDGEIQPASAPKKTPSAEERRQVLERIQRGEMTVEEGLTQLRG